MEREVIFMLMSNEQGSKRAAQVDFTRSGWQQFAKLNRKLGARFIRGFILRHELAAYLTAYEAAGTPLDEGCQEVRYEDGVYLLLNGFLRQDRGRRDQPHRLHHERSLRRSPWHAGTGGLSPRTV